MLCMEQKAEAKAETDYRLARCRCDSSTQRAITRIKLGIRPFTANIPLSLFSLIKSRVNLPEAGNLCHDIWHGLQELLQTKKQNKLPSWEEYFSRLPL